jgi:hypothetical protein
MGLIDGTTAKLQVHRHRTRKIRSWLAMQQPFVISMALSMD